MHLIEKLIEEKKVSVEFNMSIKGGVKKASCIDSKDLVHDEFGLWNHSFMETVSLSLLLN